MLLKTRSVFFVILLLLWSSLSYFSWHSLVPNVNLLRFFIGMILFLVPGILTYLYMVENKNISLFSVLGGFAVTVCFIGLIGMVSRVLQLNFMFIRIAFTLWGILMICIFFYKQIGVKFYYEKIAWWEGVLLLITLGGVIFFASITNPPLIHDDAFTYNALLYYFQHAPAFTFEFPASLVQLTYPRFWIAYWPLVEALISGLSGVDGLFITGALLPPVLALFSYAAVYSLARTLGLPRLLSGIAVLAQGISLMRLTSNNQQPGDIFFQRLTEDKVVAAFVISIVLITLAIKYFEKTSIRKIMLTLITALGMMFTHPVQFGMTCMVIGVFGLPLFLKKEMRLKCFLLIGGLTCIVLIPYLFRFDNSDYSQQLSFSLADVAENEEFSRLGNDRIKIVKGTSFYGISPSLTVGFPYEMSFIAFLISLFYFWRNKTAHYILSAFLVLGFAMLPYTGWIIGILTTPFQLWRLTWQTPFGIAIAFVVWLGFELIQKINAKINVLEKTLLIPLVYFFVYSALIVGVFFIRPWTLGNVERNTMDVSDFYANYITTANLLNQIETVGTPIIIGGPNEITNLIIPSLTMKFQPLVFRLGYESRKELWVSLVEDNIPVEERFIRLQENQIKYLLLQGEPEWVVELLETYPNQIFFVFRDGRFSLYQLNY